MNRFLYIILFLALATRASAQVKVTGRVIDLSNKPVSEVVVKLMGGNKILAFGTTDTQGTYNLELESAPTGEVTLVFSHISYEKESENLTLKDKLTKVDMLLTPKSISLKEVMVRPDPLRQMGDTLSHHLAAFLGKGDVTLEDGLKRLPGVDVSKSGSISYMGKAISQFNIEGLDLLGGKYSLATRNIPADYVTNVEIVRNIEFEAPNKELELITKYYRAPMQGEECKFLTATDILERINGSIKEQLSTVRIGIALRAMGIERVRSGNSRGYRLVEITPDQININQRALGNFTENTD